MSAAGWVGLLFVLALVPALIAARKSPSRQTGTFLTYYVFGVLLWIVAVPAAIWAVKDERRRSCPMCAEPVRVEAVRCPHCQATIAPPAG